MRTGEDGCRALGFLSQAGGVDGLTSRQIAFARPQKLMHLTFQPMCRFLEVGNFGLFGLQSVGEEMGAFDQGSAGTG
jgi:hypothetical protein